MAMMNKESEKSCENVSRKLRKEMDRVNYLEDLEAELVNVLPVSEGVRESGE